MRIVTRPDFDGVICAMLLCDVEEITAPIRWVEPSEMQSGQVAVGSGDIIANLPFHPSCSLWFDHHISNRISRPYKGLFRIAPSAAGLIFEFYRGRFSRDYTELVRQTDRIDSADLTREEIENPQRNPYLLIYMTLSVSRPTSSEERYWNHLVTCFKSRQIHEIRSDPEVARRIESVIVANRRYKKVLFRFTRLEGQVSITDLRSLHPPPWGNRFLVYSLFPTSVVNVKIMTADRRKGSVMVKVGHSILNRGCRVNVGKLLARYGGGGHRGAGSCTVDASKAEQVVSEILETLFRNEP